jgi:hypothetical protein
MFDPSMYFTGNQSGRLNSTFAYVSGSAWYKQYFVWHAYGESIIGGWCAGDFLLNADLKLSAYPIDGGVHLTARAELNSHRPSYFYQHYFSNHYQWNHDYGNDAERFHKVTETKIEASVNIPKTNTDAAFKYGLHSRYIYFDENRTLQQTSAAINVLAFTLNQKNQLWKFHFHHRFLVQTSSEPSVLDLPLFSTNFTYYFDYELVKKVLRIELGVDVQYSTSYKGYGYDPSLGMFHNSSQMLGGYLWADVFLAAQWYRATPFVKWEHANQNLWEQPNGFYSAVHYPRNFRVFKFGLSWRFFD